MSLKPRRQTIAATAYGNEAEHLQAKAHITIAAIHVIFILKKNEQTKKTDHLHVPHIHKRYCRMSSFMCHCGNKQNRPKNEEHFKAFIAFNSLMLTSSGVPLNLYKKILFAYKLLVTEE